MAVRVFSGEWHGSCSCPRNPHEVCGLVEHNMSDADTPAVETKCPLDAAKKIVAELQGMNPENQLLALHFAMRTLRLTPPAEHVAATPATGHARALQMPAAAGGTGRQTDVKSFTAAKAPKSDQQFAAVIAYFYQFEAPQDQRKDLIDAGTMKEAARQAGRKQVNQWSMTLNNAKNAGYLDHAGKGRFKLNAVGENLVAITLPGTVWGGATNGGGSGKKTAKKKAASKKASKKAG